MKLSFSKLITIARGTLLGLFARRAGWPVMIGGSVELKGLRSLTLGNRVMIGSYAVVGRDVVLGNLSSIGRNTYVDNGVTIGDRVSISRNCSLVTSTHGSDAPDRRAGRARFVSPLRIGDGCWIGTDVVILPQVTEIGAYTVVGAGAVVTRNLPANVLAVGNPARVIRELPPLPITQPAGRSPVSQPAPDTQADEA